MVISNKHIATGRWVSGRNGFTLIEVMLSVLIVAIAGLSIIAGVLFSRHAMELSKQRLAAMSYCRQALEAAQTNASIDAGSKTLVPFNTPGLEIRATITVSFYPINPDGTINWSAELATAPGAQPSLCKVVVTWNPSGRLSRPQRVSMSSIIRGGTT
jgi:prepilin-type N-terminal cleavage/methylation domain-containing protein